MKTAFHFFSLLFFSLAAISASSQTWTPRYNVSMTSKTHGYYEYLPEGYDSTDRTTTYPLILCMTGIGELGNGSSNLSLVTKWGVPKEIKNSVFPKSFTVGGQVFRFIVITPQFIKYPTPTAQDMDSALNYIVAHYKVDLNRIYITGLSYGGGLSFAYAGHDAAYAQRIAAIVPVASPIPDGGDSTIYARSRVIATNNVPVWATHNLYDHDDTSLTTLTYVSNINQPPAPAPPAKATIFRAYGHNAWDKTYDPAFKENGMNVYEWMLQYKRNIVAATNKPPTANAGADQTVTLPTNTITLSGSGTDPDGSIASYVWTKVSGPAGGAITTSGAATTTITALQQGSYVFRLTVMDNNSATATDDVTVTVNAAPNVAPQADAGTDQTITLPTNSVSLSGTATDSDGSISAYTWTKTSGPAGTITNPGDAATTVTGLVAGTYIFRLTVTDNDGATAFDDVKITVNSAANKAPVASAGIDIAITLPVTHVNLAGSGTDADGSITSYLWTKVSGPAGSIISTKDVATTAVTDLIEGVYIFRLTVTDNDGATDFDEVQVTVKAAPNQAPVADAGTDVVITLPVSTVTLSGSGTDADGTIESYTWKKISGPAQGTIAAGNMAQTALTNLVEGVYIFQLTVTDNDGATASDDVTVTVHAAPANKLPTANAGTDQSITLPVDTTTLNGSGADADGNISSYKWTKVSGPAGGVIASPNTAATTVTALQQGSYVFRLTVTDNSGATASDDIKVDVTVVTAVEEPTTIPFHVLVSPNPSTAYFNVKLTCTSIKPVNFRVMDACGRVVAAQKKLPPTSTLQIGATYRAGVYYAEFIQNGTRIVVKLLKL